MGTLTPPCRLNQASTSDWVIIPGNGAISGPAGVGVVHADFFFFRSRLPSGADGLGDGLRFCAKEEGSSLNGDSDVVLRFPCLGSAGAVEVGVVARPEAGGLVPPAEVAGLTVRPFPVSGLVALRLRGLGCRLRCGLAPRLAAR